MEYAFVEHSVVPQGKRMNYGESAQIIAALIDRMESGAPILALPVKGHGAGRSLARRLQVIAEKEGRHLEWRRSDDSLTFYFWIGRITQ